ncbi:MAG: hypothetical protein L0338_36820, partial [Acidobacteria bacterium]|nr:hypothetical protein [Acidobacteriota bacterium]
MFARGFKSWSEEYAIQVRLALGLKPVSPLDPVLLAKAIGVELWTPAQVPGLSADIAQRLVNEHSDS